MLTETRGPSRVSNMWRPVERLIHTSGSNFTSTTLFIGPGPMVTEIEAVAVKNAIDIHQWLVNFGLNKLDIALVS